MIKVLRFLCIVFSFAVLLSCTEHKKKDSIINLDIPIPLNGKQLAGPEAPLTPSSLVLVDDYLFLVDKHADRMISRISVQHPEDQARIISVGKGPGEYIRIGSISVCDNGERIVLNDDMNRKLVSYSGKTKQFSMDDIIGEMNYGGNENIYSVVPFRAGYIAYGCFGNNLFSWMNEDDGRRISFGDYPGNTSAVGSHEFMMKNQLLMAVDQSNTYFITAGVFNDWIAFYQYKDGAFTLNKEYFSYDSNLDIISFQTESRMSFSIQETSSTMRAYRYLYPAENYFYALYWGIKSTELEDNNNESYIIQFGYDGQLRKIFQLHDLLRSFAVDEQSRTIYAVTFSFSEQDIIKTYKY